MISKLFDNDFIEKNFGFPLPEVFLETLYKIDSYCSSYGVNSSDVLIDFFGIVQIEGYDARYQQTPIELFPFGRTGSDGVHYGLVAHTIVY